MFYLYSSISLGEVRIHKYFGNNICYRIIYSENISRYVSCHPTYQDSRNPKCVRIYNNLFLLDRYLVNI